MKKLNIFLLSLVTASLFIGCDGEEETEVLKNRAIAGTSITIDGSGKVQGEPADLDDLSNSDVNILLSTLNMDINVGSIEDASIIENYEVVKQYNGGTEISVGTFESLPASVNLTEVSEFLDGTSVTEGDLRIGDVFTFTVKVNQTNGESYYFKSQSFNLVVNCYADLSGTYTVTNSLCGTGETGTIPPVTITETADGGWYLTIADGGFLQYCTRNTALVNDGNISVVCGEVQATSGNSFCGGYGIGCITGGTWDQETGVLVLELNDSYFENGDYTATYTRQ